MAGSLGVSAYCDVPTFLRAATNPEAAAMVGLETLLTGDVAAGSSSVPVVASAGLSACEG